MFSGLEFWSVNHIWTYESSELNVFKKYNFLGEISSNRSNNCLRINEYKGFESSCESMWQYYNRLTLIQ